MEDRASRGRRGGWRRGARTGSDSDGFGGEHRGRGRGGHHRGRGKREHHRGRGRGGGSQAAESRPRNEGGGDYFEEEDNGAEVFSRRKLESNWDRYEESEKQEPEDDTPARRGADYRVLLESAGDSFTQFRFSEEKDWESDSLTVSQICAELVDLHALAQILQQVPLHQRLNLEAELVLPSTPVELPTVTIAPQQDVLKPSTTTGPSATVKSLGVRPTVPAASGSQAFSKAAEPPVDDNDELDQLLGLQKPVASAVEEQPAAGERMAAEKVRDEPVEAPEMKANNVPPPKSAPVRQELTDEDLEDWLDSMIS